jgi:hypothetical protein
MPPPIYRFSWMPESMHCGRTTSHIFGKTPAKCEGVWFVNYCHRTSSEITGGFEGESPTSARKMRRCVNMRGKQFRSSHKMRRCVNWCRKYI